MSDKLFNLTYRSGRVEHTNPLDEEETLTLIPDEDAPELLALEVGESFTDLDGDLWERVQ